MNSVSGLKVNVSIDGLSLSCSARSGDVFLKKVIGRFHQIDKFKKNETKFEDALNDLDKRCKHYRWLLKYEDQVSSNLLWLCSGRHSKSHLVPSLYLHFLSSYSHPLRYQDVQDTLSFLEKDHGLNFKISKIDLAIDLIHPQRINLHNRVLHSINPKKKRWIKVIKGKSKTLIAGSAKSSNRITNYDKRQQLMEVKNITVQEDISRIEIRLKPHALNNSIRTLDDLKQKGWPLNLYGRYFSLDHPQPALTSIFGKQLSRKPIWKIKDLLASKHGRTPDNFHRDYLREHKRFGPVVRKALAGFNWD